MSSGVTVSLKKTTKPFSSWGILFFLRVPIKNFWLLIFVSFIKAFPEYVIKTYRKRSLSCMPFQRKSFLFPSEHEANYTRADLDGKYQKRERLVKVRKEKITRNDNSNNYTSVTPLGMELSKGSTITDCDCRDKHKNTQKKEL